MHVVDQTVQEIAAEFRFTVEEVQEFYDKVRCLALPCSESDTCVVRGSYSYEKPVSKDASYHIVPARR
jgi:hypothetical protein